MGTIAEKLLKINETKNAIKQALINKGKNAGDVFSAYPALINELQNTDDSDISEYNICNGEIGYNKNGKIVGIAPFKFVSAANSKLEYKVLENNPILISAPGCASKALTVSNGEIILS